MRWTRGDLSFVFNGEDNKAASTLSMVVLDHQTKEYQRMRLLTRVGHSPNPLMMACEPSHPPPSGRPPRARSELPCGFSTEKVETLLFIIAVFDV